MTISRLENSPLIVTPLYLVNIFCVGDFMNRSSNNKQTFHTVANRRTILQNPAAPTSTLEQDGKFDHAPFQYNTRQKNLNDESNIRYQKAGYEKAQNEHPFKRPRAQQLNDFLKAFNMSETSTPAESSTPRKHYQSISKRRVRLRLSWTPPFPPTCLLLKRAFPMPLLLPKRQRLSTSTGM